MFIKTIKAYPFKTSPSDKSPTSTIVPSPLVTGESETKQSALLLSYESTEYTVFVPISVIICCMVVKSIFKYYT